MNPLLKVDNLTKRYSRRNPSGSHEQFLALDGVSFSVAAGTTLALVGESGSGKSTLALCISCLEKPTSGAIHFADRNLASLDERERRAMRPKIQLIFQDPAYSLNPRWTVSAILQEPLLLQTKSSSRAAASHSASLLERVGLSPDLLNRLPSELSGGQRQRVAIARALALEPKLLILDEALSALDCSVQAQVANLLLDLQRDLHMTSLFITHDLAMAAHVADDIAVMNRGRIVECGPARKILEQPESDSTRALLAAVPKMPHVDLPPAAR